MIRKKAKIILYCACRITNIYANETIICKDSVTFIPYSIKNKMHLGKSIHYISFTNIFFNFWIQFCEYIIPHFYHGIRRRCND